LKNLIAKEVYMNEVVHTEAKELTAEEISNLKERLILAVEKGSQSALIEASNFFALWETYKEKSDSEKESEFNDLLLSINQANQRIEENQKAIDISKAETRVMLDYLKEITKNVG
jgi:hypothetical protein